MESLPFSGSDGSGDKKSFWAKPEGLATLLVWAGIIGAGVYFWGVIIPFLVMVVQNTLYFVFLCAALALVVFLLTNKQIRTMVFYLWKMLMRGLAGLIVQMNPIPILLAYIDELKAKREEMRQKIDELAGAEAKLADKMNSNAERATNDLAMAAKAKQMGNDQAASLHALEAGLMQQTNEKLAPLHNNMLKLLAFLKKVESAADFTIKQTELQVAAKQDEFEAVNAGSSALRSAMKIFKGDPDKRQMFDQSMEFIQDDMAKKVGEMKRIMEFSTEFIDNADIEHGVQYDKGMALLDQYMSGQGLSILSGSSQGALQAQPVHAAIGIGQQKTGAQVSAKSNNSEWL
jgi:hypothetical protein